MSLRVVTEAESCRFCGLRASGLRRLWKGDSGATICCECVARIHRILELEHGKSARLHPPPRLIGARLTERDNWNQLHPDLQMDNEYIARMLQEIDSCIANGDLRGALFQIRSALTFFPGEPRLLERRRRIGRRNG